MMAFRYHFQHCSICDLMPFTMSPTWLWTIDGSGAIVLGYTFVTSWHPMWCPQFPSTFANIDHKRWWKMQLYRVSGRSLGEFVSTKISLTKQLIRGAPKYVFKISQNFNLLEFWVHRKHSLLCGSVCNLIAATSFPIQPQLWLDASWLLGDQGFWVFTYTHHLSFRIRELHHKQSVKWFFKTYSNSLWNY